jgi:hypothetical protein
MLSPRLGHDMFDRQSFREKLFLLLLAALGEFDLGKQRAQAS